MKIKKIFFLIIFLFILYQINTIEINEPRWIKADVGLRMRDKPNLNGKKIGVIPYGEKVILLEEIGSELVISGESGRWSKIKWNTKIGWVFGGFLSNEKIKKNKQVFITDEDIVNITWYFLASENQAFIFFREDHTFTEGWPQGGAYGTWYIKNNNTIVIKQEYLASTDPEGIAGDTKKEEISEFKIIEFTSDQIKNQVIIDGKIVNDLSILVREE